MVQFVGMLLILAAAYGVIIAVLARLILSLRTMSRQAVFASFLTYGLASGILVVFLWPNDSSVLANIFGVWLGDWIYRQAIAWIGNPYSSQAHETIPWVLQVPQVYFSASTGLSASLGLVLQRVLDHYHKKLS